MPRRVLLAGATATALLALSACGDDMAGSGMDHGSGPAPAASAPAGAAAFNDADVMFAQMMTVHHRGAVEMAALAETRAADAEVKALAGRIKAAQQPEIDTMTGWLGAWGRPAPEPGMSMPQMAHGAMPGAMSAADMTKLEAATGTAFDKQFLTMMIAHHEGAVTMGQDELEDGSNAGAKALAQKIVTDQQAEIATMRTILDRL
ncbi:DUF305 domain-containing protein [Actinoplanes auranticolor]|uniref:DUF305 domain-containing protein n=1 Tax=Actinoplanes auranticolor TaxID=47988 RepID=A0A919VL34_9ACTN|nr:DUF305 domain-containing protein [Actinoplanes auranticolor]GIM67102.1 hypothetical protein Aau02nite_25900 [Actinoplanes auranticolor]